MNNTSTTPPFHAPSRRPSANSMAVHLYRLLLASATAMIGGLIATVFVSGGWQAITIALALMAGSGVLVALLALGVMADGQGLERAERPAPAPEVRTSELARQEEVVRDDRAAVGSTRHSQLAVESH
jgi:hypothetical protein